VCKISRELSTHSRYGSAFSLKSREEKIGRADKNFGQERHAVVAENESSWPGPREQFSIVREKLSDIK
jgi:hypothetical protein